MSRALPSRPRVPGHQKPFPRYALALLTPLILTLGAWQYRWMSDDGFIYLRIVRQIQAGHGPVFNAGERVEAATSPLWLAVLSVSDLVFPIRLEWIAIILGITLTLLGLWLAILGAARLVDPSARAVLVPAGALVLAALPAMWLNASAGLETGLVFAWVGGCLLSLSRWSEQPRGSPLGLPSAVLLGIGPLVRPELLMATALWLAVVVVSERRSTGWVGRVRMLGAALALPLAYQVFRMGYYASLGPNTALAKEASLPYWDSGWRYLRSSTQPYWLWFPVLVVLVGGYIPLLRGLAREHRTRATATVISFVILAAMSATFAIRVGGDFVHGRLLLPALFALLAPVAVVPWRRSYTAVALLPVWAIACIGLLRSPLGAPRSFPQMPRNATVVRAFGETDLAWFDGHGAYLEFAKLGVSPRAKSDPVVALFAVGAVGYALGPNVQVLDRLGLGDAVAARLALPRRGLVGHEKLLPLPWVAALLLPSGAKLDRAGFVEYPRFGISPIDAPHGQPFASRVADARAALKCGELRRLEAAIDEPLDPARFVENVWESVGFWRLRIPAEPRIARRRLCAH